MKLLQDFYVWLWGLLCDNKKDENDIDTYLSGQIPSNYNMFFLHYKFFKCPALIKIRLKIYTRNWKTYDI